MSPNPPRPARDEMAPVAITTETFQKHYGRGSAAFSVNAPLPPNRHSPTVLSTQRPTHDSDGHNRSAGAPVTRHLPYHPHSHPGHQPRSRAPSAAQHGHHRPQGHPGYEGSTQAWQYHYGGPPNQHHEHETRPHSQYTNVPSHHAHQPQSFPESKVLRANTPNHDDEKKSNDIPKDKNPLPTERLKSEAIDARKRSNAAKITTEDTASAPSDSTNPGNSPKKSDVADAVAVKVSGTNLNEAMTIKEPSNPQANLKPVDEIDYNDLEDMDSEKKNTAKDTEAEEEVVEKEDNFLDDEEDPQVEPMKQDFHFFAIEKYEAIHEDCRRKVENEKIEHDRNVEEKESNRLFIQTTLLNSQLLSKWENALPATRALYMRKEEADRKRFMSEEEIASRHCATLTARKRSPKTPGGVADIPAKRSHDGVSDDAIEGNSIKHIKVE
mmetsp:Transcript_10871/g.23011  ORF Transcript_10871/g.23011 Transcript_10871/m.23011 type:complete len:438 (+) Transcript_10871:60-1373(+)